ncbi:phage portal protein family protein [Maritalea porphyrae]|uniref:phage portal protein family protein n=1 Tax=Maritalea porphyrae TaxID=880732 RepID=UPI0022AF31B5|nr:DUF935 family protein [Maritalea porphyrae]MCZ4273314.1 DUF935 family protein [Maritalea porphyrae]
MSKRNRRRNKSVTSNNDSSNRPSSYVPRNGGKLFATAKNDITMPLYTGMLENQDPTLKSQGRHIGLKLFDDLLQDGKVRTTYNKRVSKHTKREWLITPASDEQQDVDAAEAITTILKRLPFDTITKSFLKAIIKGYAVSEIVWHHGPDGWIVPEQIKSHDPARFKFDHEWQPRLLVPGENIKGIELPPRKFITHRFEAEGNNAYGMGLGSVLFWHVLFKRQGAKFWLVHLEKFASPTPFGRFPQGMSDKEQENFLVLLQNLVQNGALAAPIGTEVEFLEAKRAGEAGHQEWCRYWDEQTSEVMNGSTLSTSVKGQGARAASETHAEETQELVDDDCDQLAATLNDTLLKWICEANWPTANTPILSRPRPKNDSAEEEHKKKKHDRQQSGIQALDAARRQGFEPKDVQSWLGDVMDTEMVPIKVVATPPIATNDDAPTQEFATTTDNGSIDHLSEQLAQIAGGHTQTIVDHVKSRLNGATNYAEATNILLNAYGELEVDALGNVIGDAIALADLTGRSDIYEQTGIASSKTTGSKKKT